MASTRALCTAALALSGAAAFGQQFVDQQATRFPQPAATEYTNQVAFGDVDGDGDLDIVFANGGGFTTAQPPQPVRLYINNGSAVFTDESGPRLGGVTAISRDAQFGDIDNDGDLDLIVATDFATQPRLFRNGGNGFFTEITGTNLPAIALGSSHAAFGDIDNDGDLDLAINNGGASRFGTGLTQLFVNNGSGVYTNVTATQLPNVTVSQPMDCQFVDMDGDRDLDLFVAGRASNSSRLFRNDGTGVFTNFTVGNIPSHNTVYSFDYGDINNDGDLDILATNGLAANEGESIFVNNGTGTFSDGTAVALPGANNPSFDDNDSRFLDYDYDGDLDFTVCRIGGPERFYVNNGAGVFTLTAGIIQGINDSSLDVEVGDLDGDKDLDMVTGQGESGSFINRIYMNVGNPKDTLAPRIISADVPPLTVGGNRVVRAVVRDDFTTDGIFIAYDSVELTYTVNGGPVNSVLMDWSGGDVWRGVFPATGCGTVSYSVRATDTAGNIGSGGSGTFVAGPSGDLDNDGDVDDSDLGILLASFNFNDGGDIDGDGDTDDSDLGILLAQFGVPCS